MNRKWKWRPALGRWSIEEFGYPDRPTAIAVSTAMAGRSEAYDFWCEIALPDFRADTAKDDRQGFQASGRGLSWQEADFFLSRSAPLSVARDKRQIDKDGLDNISIGFVMEGIRAAGHADGTQSVTRVNDMFVYDTREPGRIAWTQHEAMFMVLRRKDVREAMGQDDADTAHLEARLAQSALKEVLRDQFALIARHMHRLDTDGQALLLRQAKQTALLALSGPDSGAGESAMPLFQAAIRYIRQNLPDPGLDADRIARALGCSRATLYRAFEINGASIARTISDLRLDRIRQELETVSPAVSIQAAALRFGIYDTANLSRQFRRRFGLSPTDVRKRDGD